MQASLCLGVFYWFHLAIPQTWGYFEDVSFHVQSLLFKNTGIRMVYGITGNIHKDELWRPVTALVSWLQDQSLPFKIEKEVAEGLYDRDLISSDLLASCQASKVAHSVDIVLSFGGDGTLLRSAHEANHAKTPLLGINIGRLGFLADTEVTAIHDAIQRIETGEYRIEKRTLLEVDVEGQDDLSGHWALNEFVLERGGPAGLINIDVHVDGVDLNRYWADGLIIATPTGSTAYSLAAGGPIVMPGANVILLSPLAPHSLTVRPLVLPESAVVEARVQTGGQPYVLAADGSSVMIEEEEIRIEIRRSEHYVRLVKFPEQQYFRTLRTKLMWGADDYRQKT